MQNNIVDLLGNKNYDVFATGSALHRRNSRKESIAMANLEKVLRSVLAGRSDSNIGFTDLRNLLKRLGWEERIKGSHHIFYREGAREIINLQPKGAKAKSYQVKQVRGMLSRMERN